MDQIHKVLFNFSLKKLKIVKFNLILYMELKVVYKPSQKEVLRIIKQNDNEYFIYKKNYTNNEHKILSLIDRASDTNNIKRFIIKEIEQLEYKNNIYSKYPLYKQGDLFSFIGNEIISKETVNGIICQILSAVEYIHNLGILHRDIKTENILINDSGDIVLTDFEFSAYLGNNMYIHDKLYGTVEYLSPEIILYRKYSKKSDIYACIIIFYEMLVKQIPFKFNINKNLQYYNDINKIIETFWKSLRGYDFIHKSLHSEFEHKEIQNISDIFVNILCKYELDTYNMNYLKKNDYFKNCDWDNLDSKIKLRPIKSELGYIDEYINQYTNM